MLWRIQRTKSIPMIKDERESNHLKCFQGKRQSQSSSQVKIYPTIPTLLKIYQKYSIEKTK
jgi:hypothetical protein